MLCRGSPDTEGLPACININGVMVIDNENRNAIYVDGITGNYADGIYIDSTKTNGVAISGFNEKGVYIKGDIKAHEASEGTIGVSISGSVSGADGAIDITDEKGVITGNTGIHI